MSGSSEHPQIERRRAPRAPADFGLRLASRSGRGGEGDTTEARVKDLSTGGLCCLHAQPLREMTLVDLQLELPGLDETAHVQGAVVRSEKVRGMVPASYEIAVFFTDMDPRTRRAIEQYVGAQLRS